MVDIAKQLQDARQRLLDISLRNRLVSFRPSKTGTIRVIDEIPAELYDILVIQERKMEFLPKQEETQAGLGLQDDELSGSGESGATIADLTEEEVSTLWKLPAPDVEVAERHRDYFLQTALQSQALQKRLFHINQSSRSILEELGYSTLYLAMGFLEWLESPNSSQPRLAPLVLVPVELERAAVRSSFKLQWNGDDISTNISLQWMLQNRFDLSIPDLNMPNSKSEIDKYFGEIDKSINESPQWRVTNDVYLGFFSFTKFTMYRDLDPNAWPEGRSPTDHPLVKAILDPSSAPESDLGFAADDVDQKLDFRQLFHVMDADSSQVAVIEDAKAGRNLVVEGPPGTGKSQTITNIIAELLASGKSVLFVSEKMAALDVVKKRLDQVGLGDYCLELHSRKAKRREVVRELERTISALRPKSVSLDDAFDQLDSLREDLNGYAEALGTPFGKLDLTPFDLMGVKERAHCHFADKGRPLPRVRLGVAGSCTQAQYNDAKWKLKNLEDALATVAPLASHPWHGCRPGIVLPSDVEEVGEIIDECAVALQLLQGKIAELASICGIVSPETLGDLPQACDAARFVTETVPIDRAALLNPQWDDAEANAQPLLLEIKGFQDQRFHLSTRLAESSLEIDAESILEEFKAISDTLTELGLIETGHDCLEELPSDAAALRELIHESRRACKALEQATSRLTKVCATVPPTTLGGISRVRQAAECLASLTRVEKEVLTESKWDSAAEDARLLVNDLEEFRQMRSAILSRFKDRAMDIDITPIADEYEVRSARIPPFRLFDSRYRYLKQKVIGLYREKAPRNSTQLITDLQDISRCQRRRDELRGKRELGQSLFGSHWREEESDPETLNDMATWVPAFRTLLSQQVLTAEAIGIGRERVSKEEIENANAQVASASQWFVSSSSALYDRANTTSVAVFGGTDDEVPLADIQYRLDQWDSELSRLEVWAQKISGLHCQNSPPPKAVIIDDLEAISAWQNLRREIRGKQQLGQALFGSHWHSESSDFELLGSFVTWIPTFRRLLQEGKLGDEAAGIISAGVSRDQVEGIIEVMGKAEQQFADALGRFAGRIGASRELIFGADNQDMGLSDFISHLNAWRDELPALQPWAQFLHLREACLGTAAERIVEAIEDCELEPTGIIPCFEGNFADDVLGLAFRERASLRQFVASVHESKLQRFSVLDRQLIEWNRRRLLPRLYDNRPRIHYGASGGSEVGFVLSEIKRKRRYRPIRQLMATAGGFIQCIKPCFMMSPLSIAQFLTPHTAPFDVVVFDEASQVKPEDALGALLRGSQVIVMGDTRQLPPTTFFESEEYADDVDDQETVAPITDVESILHQCSLSFPTKQLRWHYRSKHESLIAVSNQEFYDNRLFIYPSAVDTAPHLGLKFVYLPDAPYDRGRSAANRTEARAVIVAAFEHYRKHPSKSLGVGTFNRRQQQAILEELELQLRLDPEMETHFKGDRPEHFFVKNLETIQGDERDVIFVSIGFGFDEHGRLHRTFGPVNQDGGERRLNVLMTRAREACIIFSNFHASDLAIDSDGRAGLRALKLFLEYAENRILGELETHLDDTDSPFEDSVYDVLSSYGYQLRKQVGCAGFRVDLAVVDPDSPGRYMLGIECDGAKYHSSRVARDRDRLRQQILENKGWRIHRIWSTDWYRNRKDAVETLRLAVERARLPQEASPVPQLDDPVLSSEADVDDDHEAGDGAPHGPAAPPGDTLDDVVPEYLMCSSLGMVTYGDIHEYSRRNLAHIVEHIVDVEGPVHISEVVQRIRTLWGLKRSGQRISDAIHLAAAWAVDNQMVKQKGDFLWPSVDREVTVRRRGGSVPPDIDLVCDEEISEAVKLVLKSQYATLPDDLVRQTSRLLGILATSARTSKRISEVIDRLIASRDIREMPNGMLDMAYRDPANGDRALMTSYSRAALCQTGPTVEETARLESSPKSEVAPIRILIGNIGGIVSQSVQKGVQDALRHEYRITFVRASRMKNIRELASVQAFDLFVLFLKPVDLVVDRIKHGRSTEAGTDSHSLKLLGYLASTYGKPVIAFTPDRRVAPEAVRMADQAGASALLPCPITVASLSKQVKKSLAGTP